MVREGSFLNAIFKVTTSDLLVFRLEELFDNTQPSILVL